MKPFPSIKAIMPQRQFKKEFGKGNEDKQRPSETIPYYA